METANNLACPATPTLLVLDYIPLDCWVILGIVVPYIVGSQMHGACPTVRYILTIDYTPTVRDDSGEQQLLVDMPAVRSCRSW